MPACMQGADTVIFERLDPGNALNAQLKEVTRAHMEAYGEAGLRTLCLAAVELDAAEYDACAARARANPAVGLPRLVQPAHLPSGDGGLLLLGHRPAWLLRCIVHWEGGS